MSTELKRKVLSDKKEGSILALMTENVEDGSRHWGRPSADRDDRQPSATVG